MKRKKKKINFLLFSIFVLVLMIACTTYLEGAFIVVVENKTEDEIVFHAFERDLVVAPGIASQEIPIQGVTGRLVYPHTKLYGWFVIENKTDEKKLYVEIFDKKSDVIKVIVLTDEIWSYEYGASGDAYGKYVDGKIVEVKKGE